ncbi:uncharacterized protein LOC126896169 isoform X8 [Daktulosphaira vitifoliae]|uniref:uncharacterized protein LOC126896169 isoform X8 n=1 Tax=Daktulosphaira vitifoliae TaxID=58002 RepID=UPI0021AACEBE|nr:uncharacterized protein LOC126896169 isoform X8 [Daktulosphaira vitifoliae]
MSISILALFLFCVVNEISSTDPEALKNNMAFTNFILENLKNDVSFSLNSFVEFMESIMKNQEKGDPKRYLVPPSNDITGVTLQEQTIHDYLCAYYINNGLTMVKPEVWINNNNSETSLLKEYEKRYELMKELYNISDETIQGLRHIRLINPDCILVLENNKTFECIIQ